MEFMGITAIASITVICYLAAELAQALGLSGKFIPVLCGGAGAVLGAAGLFLMEDFPAPDIITAVAVGIVSGLAATGTDQLIKQLGK